MHKNLFILSILFFSLGCFFSSLQHNFISQAKAEVAGMDYYDLKSDYDFKKAVKAIVDDDCSTDGTDIICH